MRWNYNKPPYGPNKGAFDPTVDRTTGVQEFGISTYLATLTTPRAVLQGFEGYGLVKIDLETLFRELARVRSEYPCPEIVVEYDPVDVEKGGPAGEAHCYLEPIPKGSIILPAIVQKALRRVSVVDTPAGPERPGTGVVGERLRSK
jgi:hypothetical protein